MASLDSSHRASIALALQGGGSHGAFAWGVLDRLLEDHRFEIEAISGASAGSVNAVALAHGLLQDGRDGARASLQSFWDAIAAATPPGFFHEPLTENALHATPSPSLQAFLALARFFAPYQLNPFDLNPLREILEAQIDFEQLRKLGQAVSCDDPRANRHAAPVSHTRNQPRGRVGFGVLAAAAPHGGDRWRGLLGWRTDRQPPTLSTAARVHCARYCCGAAASTQLARASIQRRRHFAPTHRDKLRRRLLQRVAGNCPGAEAG